jgi:hypothetical protein
MPFEELIRDHSHPRSLIVVSPRHPRPRTSIDLDPADFPVTADPVLRIRLPRTADAGQGNLTDRHN